MLTRTQALKTVTQLITDELVIHCNGYIGRESFTLGDRIKNFYMIGSMGLASSIGLGLALSNPDQGVIVFDGDGNVLMNLGALSTIGAFQPKNYIHLVFDNGVYGSTGNQATLSPSIDLSKIASAVGYRKVKKPITIDELTKAFQSALNKPGPSFIHIPIQSNPEEKGIGRVTHTPEEITFRFRSAVSQHQP